MSKFHTILGWIFLFIFYISIIAGESIESTEQMKGVQVLKSYTEDSLKEIAFPIGGIGTGSVSLSGRGHLRDWEIFGRPDKGRALDYTIFAIWVKAGNEPPIARVLERKYNPPYYGSGYRGAGHGLARRQLAGVARLENVIFRGEYPFAWIDFEDANLPITVSLEAWNPLIPLNVKDSSIPVAIFTWTLRNTTNKKVDLSLASTISNPIGDTYTNVRGEKPGLGGNVNEYREGDGYRGLYLYSQKVAPDDPAFGTMALVTKWNDLDVQTRWYRGGWWDKVHIFWDDFSKDGQVEEVRDVSPSVNGKTDYGCLILHAHLEPGETVELPILISWHFPNRENYWNLSTQTSDYWISQDFDVYGKMMKNRVAFDFRDAWHVAGYTVQNLNRLKEETCLFHDALFSSTLPKQVLDALSSQTSTLKTNVCLLLENGSFFGFEGSSDHIGCCPMNCTHVWNYAQTPAFLFPELERSARETDFLHNTFPNGFMAFRTILPLGDYWWHYKPAADGQMGTIVRAYREWQFSGDTKWLRKIWPKVQLALEFAWKGSGNPPPENFAWTADYQKIPWDPDKRGVMDGKQHNTYDIEFYGPNTLTGSMYLAALKAASEMARAMGDENKAKEYIQLYNQGKLFYDSNLWNGEYYVQEVSIHDQLKVPDHLISPELHQTQAKCVCNSPPDGRKAALVKGETIPKYQYGAGCLSDQLLGQFLAHVTGLGYILDPDHVRRAVKSIYDYNFKRHVGEHDNVQRVFALNDEPGLLLCTWPKGERPALPFVYSDEVWTGIEYQIAALLIYNGLVDEGLEIVRSVRERYAGYNRNPWDEEECGHHYARAMSSWSLLLALAGFEYSGVQKKIGFAPAIHPEDFRTFWSSGSGWGVFSQQNNGDAYKASLDVNYGSLDLKKIHLGYTGRMPQKIILKIGNQNVKADYKLSDGNLIFEFEQEQHISKNESLVIRLDK